MFLPHTITMDTLEDRMRMNRWTLLTLYAKW